MKIQYKNAKCQKQCEDLNQAKKDYPTEVALKLMAHINFIKQAASFVDIMNYPPFHFHKLEGDRKNLFSLDIGRKLGYRIIIDPLDENNTSLKNEKELEIIPSCCNRPTTIPG